MPNEVLTLAWHEAARGKRGLPAAATFEYHLEDNLIALQSDLRDKTYRPGPYASFLIHDPKRRLISAAPFRDRIVHHALCNVIEPVFERGFIYDSYANRVGKGTHAALDRCQGFARQFRFALQGDVEQFFPAVDHALLRDRLARKIHDGNVLWLIDQILASGVGVLGAEYDMCWFDGDDLWAALRPRGLPIGNLTSQFWANCHLDPFDHFVKRGLGCRAYLRYVDDFILFADSPAVLAEWLAEIKGFMARLRLTLHPNSQPRPVTEGLSFLGFRVFPDHRRLKRRNGIRFARKLRHLRRAYLEGAIPFEALTAAIHGWVNHARYANTTGLRKAILAAPIAGGPRSARPEGAQPPLDSPRAQRHQRPE